MASLEELRAQLGSVDDKIVELYEERMKLCEEIGICKIENGYKTFDRQREKNTITDVMNKVSSDINKKGIGEVYEQLLAISRKLQYKQLVEAGALGRLPFIGIDLLDKDTARRETLKNSIRKFIVQYKAAVERERAAEAEYVAADAATQQEAYGEWQNPDAE